MKVLAALLLFISAAGGPAVAQTPAEALVGTWVNKASKYCNPAIVVVTAVEPNGTVRGSFTCTLRGWKPVMGDKIDRDSVKGTLIGNRFRMENAEGGGFDVILEGKTLRGTGIPRAGGERGPAEYVKQ